MKLPSRALTDLDLKYFAKALQIPHFRGVYMRNNLPSKPRKNECAILNLDDKNNPGTHWTAFVINGKDIKYFDSMGNLKPPLEVIKYFRSVGSPKIIYNYNRYQNFNSYECGHLCLKFLYLNSHQ